MSFQPTTHSDIDPDFLANLTAEIQTKQSNNAWREMAKANVQYTPGATAKPRMMPSRSIMRTRKNRVTRIDPKYTGTILTLTRQATERVYAVDPAYSFADGNDNAQTGLSAVAGTAWSLVGARAGDRFDILNASGKRVWGVTALTIAGTEEAYGAAGTATAPAEGIDWELDRSTCQIVLLQDSPDDTWTPTITSPTIAAGHALYMARRKPMRLAFLEVPTRIMFYQPDGTGSGRELVMWHDEFMASIFATAGHNADGDADSTYTLDISILTEGQLWILESQA